MSRWKTLPESLDPGVRRLVVRMRQLKDRSGLSLAALAAKTASSRSSWERYLNGKAVPPPQAVEALARVSGTDPAPLLALWEVATRVPDPSDQTSGEASGAASGAALGETAAPSGTRSGTTGGEPGGGAGPEPASRAEGPADEHGRRLGRASLVSALAVVLIAAATALLAVRPWESPEGSASEDASTSASEQRTEPDTPQSTGASPTTYPCQFHVYEDSRYAGHSTTQDAEFGVGSNGEPIAEVQCLVRFHGFDPGPIDGIYGPLTTEAVEAFQRSVGLPADGLVGPMTWQALRDVS
ncbi:peptidoglycan-binding protein [Streptomyces sp. B6B3]|uniref:peptidoglycan-binding protein n=1 Tax=Streptomyces sp. B6B3 TaxID=3153570 RepID=UPI00325E5BC7